MHNESLELSPYAWAISCRLCSLWFYKLDSAAQLNSMLCGEGLVPPESCGEAAHTMAFELLQCVGLSLYGPRLKAEDRND